MTALLKEPSKPAQLIELPDDQHQRIFEMMRLVGGGWIDLVKLTPTLGAFVSANGRMLGMKRNVFCLLGTAIFLGICEDNQTFTDLPQDEPLLLEVI
jgi:hypothetical protein